VNCTLTLNRVVYVQDATNDWTECNNAERHIHLSLSGLSVHQSVNSKRPVGVMVVKLVYFTDDLFSRTAEIIKRLE